jgi:hypothetical protein
MDSCRISDTHDFLSSIQGPPYARVDIVGFLNDLEATLVDMAACGHAECDRGVCTHPLKKVRELRDALVKARKAN